MRIDELSTHQEESKSTVNQLTVQIQELQHKVNSLSVARECCDPETTSGYGLSHVPCQPVNIRNTRGLMSRDSCLQPDRRRAPSESSCSFLGKFKSMASAPCERRKKIGEKPSVFCNSNPEICKEVFNLETSLSMQKGLIRKIGWLGYRGIKSGRRKRVVESYSSRRKSRMSFIQTILWNLTRLIMESLYIHTPSIRNTWYC